MMASYEYQQQCYEDRILGVPNSFDGPAFDANYQKAKEDYYSSQSPELNKYRTIGLFTPMPGVGIAGTVKNTGKTVLKKTIFNAIKAPTNRRGLATTMLKLGEKPFVNAQAHHGLPWKYREWFAKRGLNVNDSKFGAWVKGGGNGGHQSWSKGYDEAWNKYISRNPNATAEQVETFYNSLRQNKQWGGGF